MAARSLLLCSVLLAALVGGQAARRRYTAPPRSPQRRFGAPFSGDIREQSFENYLSSNGVSFDSLFEEPTDLRSEPAPAGRRSTPPAAPYQDSLARPGPYRDSLARPDPYEDSFGRPAPYEDSFGRPAPYEDSFGRPAPYEDSFGRPAPYEDSLARPAPYEESSARRRPTGSYRERAPRPPQTFLYGDEPVSYSDEPVSYSDKPLSYGDVSGRRRPAGPAEQASAERPERRQVAVSRPEERPRRPVVALRPAPAAADPPASQQQSRELLPFIDQPQAEAAARQDGYSLNIPPKQEKQRLEFQVHGQEGPHSYRFGYDTGTGYNRQFRFEERDGYGNTKGRYGFYDKSGKLQVVNYSASPKGGFHAEGDFGKYPKAGH